VGKILSNNPSKSQTGSEAFGVGQHLTPFECPVLFGEQTYRTWWLLSGEWFLEQLREVRNQQAPSL